MNQLGVTESTWLNSSIHTFPRISELKVSKVITTDVLAVLQPIWLEKPEAARRIRQRIGTVMKWAVANDWRTNNPAYATSNALPKQTDTQKHRKALPYDKFPEFLEALKASDAGAAT